ncbi:MULTISPECIES: cytochrome c biogenesis protein CcdA [unclassified Halorubrum]|uniref:cytochrome c biogenesis protein CcdA n=1 Tax=unclassified Halorubrum TaxID=2642239 RepID=UPI000B99BBBE|nr:MULTISPECIES: cytochrome c biogenesis protein CcdA [unclassified Halorubrum]OYR39730.1 cytochrome C biogenesis protein [Halorubrum sp. Hd13]OYR47676.1 cytochrome C biogenesis protein [Halorubrum sp. Ea8]OYR48526.1 cytochrome C biogenesis protein [Halorubrum sp. Eb13]OYR51133.1 cytochrome C biogenesis protein [Halorubrum sp. Ea1]
MTDVSLATNVPFAVTAGVATFFSPCAYPLLPGYVGFYVNSVDAEAASVSGAGLRGVAAALGVLATFALLAGATVRIGYSTLSNITVFETLVGVLLVIFGLLVVAGRAPSVSLPLPKRRSSVFGFGVFGAGYALAGAGCVAPVFLGVVARAIALPGDAAVLILSVYAGTVAVLMAATTVATGVGLIGNANRVMAHAGALKRVAGAVMVVAGIGQLYLSLVVY